MNIVSYSLKFTFNKKHVKNVILGCTHYPIVIEKFKKKSPDINFINPAYEQVLYIKELMEQTNIFNNKGKSTFHIYTTGKKENFLKTMETLFLKSPDDIYEVEEF